MHTEYTRKVWNCRSYGDCLMSEQEGKLVYCPLTGSEDAWNAKELENKMQHSP